MNTLILFIAAVISIPTFAAPLDCQKLLKGESAETPPQFISARKLSLAQNRLQRFSQLMMNQFGADKGVYSIQLPNWMKSFVPAGQPTGFYIVAGGDYVGTALRRD